jgi:hypothetical protein
MFQDEQPRIVSRGGTTYTQNTGNIGKSKRAEAEPPQVETKIVTVEAPATGVTETGTAVVKARGVMPDPPSPARKPADREAAAFDNIARQLDCFVEITEAMPPEGFLNVRGSYTPVRLNGIVDDALFAIGWLQKFVQLARSDSRLDDTPHYSQQGGVRWRIQSRVRRIHCASSRRWCYGQLQCCACEPHPGFAGSSFAELTGFFRSMATRYWLRCPRRSSIWNFFSFAFEPNT